MKDVQKSRRTFLKQSSLGALGVALASEVSLAQNPAAPTPGAPPAFGTAPPAGPEVTTATFAEAEKLMRVELTAADRAEAAGNWRVAMAPLYERRVGPHKVALEDTLAPYSRWNCTLPDTTPDQ